MTRRSTYQVVRSPAALWGILPLLLLLLLLQAVAAGSKPGPTPPPGGPVVIIKTNRAVYGIHEPITVVITNASRSPVALLGGGYFCSVVRLEHRTAQGWAAQENCPLLSVPAPEPLGPRAKTTLTFPLKSQPGVTGGRTRGTFRFMVIFEASDQKDRVARGLVAYSEPFVVK